MPAAPVEGLLPSSGGFLGDDAHLVALRKRFEGYTGPVLNAGGVR
jgi:hypothetical protein